MRRRRSDDRAPQEAVCVFRTEDRVAAHVVTALLNDLGFDARLAGVEAGSVIAAPVTMSLRVRVPGEDAAQAVAALGRLTRTDARGRVSLVDEGEGGRVLTEADLDPSALGRGEGAAEPQDCPRCGEPWEPGFEVCWSCLWELPDAPDEAP